MPYQLKPRRPISAEIKRVMRRQIDSAIAIIDNSESDPQESVHRVRTCCKNIRALLCLIEPSLGKDFKKETIWYKEIAAALSNLRDADAMVESVDKLLTTQSANPEETLIDEVSAEWLQQQLQAKKDQTVRDGEDTSTKLHLAKARLLMGRKRLKTWWLQDKGFNALSSGLEKTYAQARRRMKRTLANPSNKNIHNWRKLVKKHHFHLFLLTKTWPTLLASHRGELKRLGEILGDDHDLAVLTEFVITAEADSCKDSILGAIDVRRKNLHTTANSMGERLFAEKPKALRKRFQVYWEASL